ncbi:MAG: phage/plasmid primase, P4 family [Methylococcus sp.]|nr:phage/plasmid primase, P4 family [Methylococcus sp.]
MSMLPLELREAKRWLVWKSLPNGDKKPRKVPFYVNGAPRSGTLDTPDDQARLGTYDEACTALASGQYAGLGFALGPDVDGNCWQGVDFDDSANHPEHELLLSALPGGYVEHSPSGNGMHVIGRGDQFATLGSNSSGIEAYASGRFFTVTGKVFREGSICCLAGYVTELLRPQHSRPAPTAAPTPVPGTTEPVQWPTLVELKEALVVIPADDHGVWVAMGQALCRLGEEGWKLWNEWSAKSPKYDGAEAARRWASFTGDRTGYRAVFAEADRHDRNWRRRPTPARAEIARDPLDVALLQRGNQDTVALVFSRRYDGRLLYNHARGAWLEWDGVRWRLETTERAFNFCRDLARELNPDGRVAMGSANFAAGVEKLARADPTFAVDGTKFDSENYLLNTPSGTIDLRTGAMRPHDPADRITLCTGAAPAAEGGGLFERFLSEITCGDVELARLLQVSLGACLSGAVEAHWMLFWIGGGRNGKNTLGDLVADAMGEYAKKVPSALLMAKQHEGHPTEIASLQGVRLALSSEVNDGDHWAEARINELTGDDTISARFMRGDFFTFKRTHKHLIYGNHRPQLRSIGDAVKARIKIVPFRASFAGREDPDLPRKLRENLGYVLHWLVEGHRMWMDAGKRLPHCQAVEAESQDYFASQSTVELWLAERVVVIENDERPVRALPKASELYRDYELWKRERGESPASMTRWGEAMRKFEKLSSGGVRYRGVILQARGPFAVATAA